MSSEKKNIVIIGGGIIGCTSAYFLTRHPSYDPSKHSITLIEASQIAGGASGKAGGLLGLWAYPSSIVPLSYRLHEQLAKEHNGEERWGYRKIHVGQLSAKARPQSDNSNQAGSAPTANNDGNAPGESVSLQKRTKEAIGLLRAAGIPKDLDWFSADCVRSYDEMGSPSNTAQVHPYQFTTSMADLAAEKGCKIILGSVTKINYTTTSGVESITYRDQSTSETHTLPATDVIVSAGPWTASVLPGTPISALRAHSVTIRPSRPVSAYALFTEIALPKTFKPTTKSTQHVTPEIYARPNNEVYCCGEGDHLVPLPSLSSSVEVDLTRCADIVDHVAAISDELRDGQVTARQACYLPQVDTHGGGPLIGHTGVKGLFLAAGHTCWGIQNGPATGKLISEFVFDGDAKSAKVVGLDPRRVLRL